MLGWCGCGGGLASDVWPAMKLSVSSSGARKPATLCRLLDGDIDIDMDMNIIVIVLVAYIDRGSTTPKRMYGHVGKSVSMLFCTYFSPAQSCI